MSLFRSNRSADCVKKVTPCVEALEDRMVLAAGVVSAVPIALKDATPARVATTALAKRPAVSAKLLEAPRAPAGLKPGATRVTERATDATDLISRLTTAVGVETPAARTGVPVPQLSDLAGAAGALDLASIAEMVKKERGVTSGAAGAHDQSGPAAATFSRASGATDALRSALEAAGLSPDALERLFGRNTSSQSQSLFGRNAQGQEQAALLSFPGQTQGPDLMGFRSAAEFRASISGADDPEVVESHENADGSSTTIWSDGTVMVETDSMVAISVRNADGTRTTTVYETAFGAVLYKETTRSRPNENAEERGPMITAEQWQAKRIDPYVNPTEFSRVEIDVNKLAGKTLAMVQSKVNPNPKASTPDGPITSYVTRRPGVAPGVADPTEPPTGAAPLKGGPKPGTTGGPGPRPARGA